MGKSSDKDRDTKVRFCAKEFIKKLEILLLLFFCETSRCLAAATLEKIKSSKSITQKAVEKEAD